MGALHQRRLVLHAFTNTMAVGLQSLGTVRCPSGTKLARRIRSKGVFAGKTRAGVPDETLRGLYSGDDDAGRTTEATKN